MMGKKKIIIAIGIIVCFILGLYILVFAKPRVKCTSVKVMSFENASYSSSENRIDYIVASLLEDANIGYDLQLQSFWQGDLPSYEEDDYGILAIDIEVINSTLYDSYGYYLLVDECDNNGILVVTSPQMGQYVFKRCSKTKLPRILTLYIYTKDKSKEEIKDMVQSMVLQVPYSNKINDTGSVKISLKDVPIEFALD